jgi:hypothetical protein
MGALRLTLRAELRRRWRPMLMLALLLAIPGGVVLTAAAGAERTDTAYPRLRGQITVQGTIVPAIGVAPVRGRDFLSLLAGRPPARQDEIALGAQTLQALHRRIGQRILIQVNGATRSMLITGTAVFAAFSRGSFESTDLGIGLVRRQVLGVVEWQALSLAGAALLIGVPLGLLAGRWAWTLLASSAGLAPAASIPLALVLLMIPVTAVLAALIAAWPGQAAARIRPATVLRAE